MTATITAPADFEIDRPVEGNIAGHFPVRPDKPPAPDLPYIPLIRTKTIEGLPALLERMNVRFEDLLKRAGLPLIPLDRHADLLPMRDVLAVAEYAARATGIQHFGVLLATFEGLDALGEYGRYIKAAPTLLEAVRRASRFISWQNLGVHLTVATEGTACVWRYHLSPAVRADRHHAYLFALVILRDIVRLAAGPNWFPREVRLEAAAPGGPCRRLEEAFGERITWDAGENALVLGRDLLGLPLLWARQGGARRWADEASTALESSMPPADFVGSLRQIVRSFLRAGYPRASLLAHASELSLRSFQRALATADLTFSDLVEQVRFEMATEMIHRPGARLIDISLELGYSDAANFTRAFKRWTGQTPRAYRRGADDVRLPVQ